MADEIKEAIIEEFRAFVEESEGLEEGQAEGNRQVDLYTVLSEFVALKNEVKIEARQFKAALERFGSALDAFKEEKLYLSELLEQSLQENKKAKRESLKSLLMQLLELRDRIEAGLEAAESYKPRRFSLASRKRERAVIRGLRDGQELSLKRIDQLLASYEVRPIEVLDRKLDPNSMRAAEVERIPGLGYGTVTGELRKGFYWESEILRAAEVKVNQVE